MQEPMRLLKLKLEEVCDDIVTEYWPKLHKVVSRLRN